jgi:hypothetical protein
MAVLRATEVSTELQEVRDEIFNIRARLHTARLALSSCAAELANIPNEYADLISTVNDAAYTGDAFKNANKAELVALTAEFVPLRSRAEAVRDYANLNTVEF